MGSVLLLGYPPDPPKGTAAHRALKGHSTVFNITFIISNFAHLHINQKILRKINPMFSFFSVYRILSN